VSIDLSLISIDDLFAEIFKRTELCVYAYHRYENAGDPIIRVGFDGESTLGLLGLCDVLRDAILVHHKVEQEIEDIDLPGTGDDQQGEE